MTNAIITGSLGAIAKQNNQSIAETFLSADVIVIVDTSGSMAIADSRNGNTRYDVACEELTNLQANLPGKIAVIAFSSDVQFCPNGQPFNYTCGTNMAKALRFAKVADVPDMKFFLISDGEPDCRDSALEVAAQYKNTINGIYVGPEDRPSGRDFLKRLAEASGGQMVTADRAKELANEIVLLLDSGDGDLK